MNVQSSSFAFKRLSVSIRVYIFGLLTIVEFQSLWKFVGLFITLPYSMLVILEPMPKRFVDAVKLFCFNANWLLKMYSEK